jgi:glycolate oxidase iron-sulfur subunit
MRGLADGVIEPTPSVIHHLDLCLDCRGCETACPSGVVYHELIEETRARFKETGVTKLTLSDRLQQWVFFHLFTHPTRLKLLLLPVRILQKLRLYPIVRQLSKLLPPTWQKMEQMLPPAGPLWPSPLATGHSPLATSPTVGFFSGCIGSVMFDKTNQQAVDLLAAAGANVIAPPKQTCCGAIHHHNGAHAHAQTLARQNIDAFLPLNGPQADFVTTTIAGCGAMLHEYDHLLRDDPAYADRAKEFVKRVRDISEVLLHLGLPPLKHAVKKTVTYHDACHLLHAQKVSSAPRKLLAQVPGLTLIPLPESDICCGAAGTYNLTQPAMATDLAARKLKNIAATHAPICLTGNVGCSMHIQSQARAQNQPLQVLHPVEILHEAVFGPDGKSPTAP